MARGGAMFGDIGMDDEEDSPSGPMAPLAMGPEDKVTKLARKAFPDADWTPERVSALEGLISHCMGAGDDYGDEEAEEPEEDEDGGKKSALILALGGPKLKRK
jgi:hypothetical protein